MTHPRRRPIRLPAAVCAVALALSVLPSAAIAAPLLVAQQATADQMVTARVLQASPAVTPAGQLRAEAAVDITAPAEYLEVRLRLLSPTGRLIYQKTEVRADLPPGRHLIDFQYDIAPLALPTGRYPIEVRVLATGAEPTNLDDRLLIVPGDAPALPVAVIARIAGTPAVGPDGRFTRDPAQDTRLRDDVAFLTQLAMARRAPLALAIAPVLLEQLARAGDGYETSDGTAVPADSETAARYARAVGELRTVASTGTITMLDVPYALPDLDGLEEMEAADDLTAHWNRADAVVAAVLGARGPGPVAFVGEHPTASALGTLAGRGTAAVVASADALRSEGETITPGAYRIAGHDTVVLAADTAAAEAVAGGAAAFYDVMFDRLLAGEPIALMLEIGPGASHTAIEVQQVLDWIAGAGWLKAVEVGDLASPTPDTISLGQRPPSWAPPLFWSSIAEGRASALAYAVAAGETDAEADAMLRAMLVSESALWAGGDRRWGDAPEALAMADHIVERVGEEFSEITIEAKDVTLSGSRGDVPLALTNGTGKQLTLTLVATSEQIGLPKPAFAVAAEPAETFVTVPVNLGRIMDGELHVAVVAGTLQIAETTVHVRASHLDRLATLGMVVLVLVVLLFFIRRRVRAADAATIATGADGAAPERVTHPDE